MKIKKLIGMLIITFVATCSQFVYAVEVTDAAIVNDIHTKFSSNPDISELDIKVTSNAGVVSLQGNVKTDQEASTVIELAESTPGVVDTNTTNLMVEESKHPFTDTVITAKVKGTYAREKLFGNKDVSVMGIKVETTNGTVSLTGMVDSQEQIDNAVKLAKSIDGVKQVDSKLTIKPGA